MALAECKRAVRSLVLVRHYDIFPMGLCRCHGIRAADRGQHRQAHEGITSSSLTPMLAPLATTQHDRPHELEARPTPARLRVQIRTRLRHAQWLDHATISQR